VYITYKLVGTEVKLKPHCNEILSGKNEKGDREEKQEKKLNACALDSVHVCLSNSTYGSVSEKLSCTDITWHIT
jgi:hypothetical protein